MQQRAEDTTRCEHRYRVLLSEREHLISEAQAWRIVFEEEHELMKELYRTTRRQIAETRMFLAGLNSSRVLRRHQSYDP